MRRTSTGRQVSQFTTRMSLNNVNVEVVTETKLLGTHLRNDLKWDKNTKELTRKS